MSAIEETDPRYPIGRLQVPETITAEHRAAAIAAIAAMPGLLKAAVKGLGRQQLETPYRDGGWTVRQTVHHIADSHINATVRLRWALTEDWPTIKIYYEKEWSELHDVTSAPIEWSLELLENLHPRWVFLLDSLTDEQWQRGVIHPESGRLSVDKLTQIYGWHSKHHVAHITRLRERKGW